MENTLKSNEPVAGMDALACAFLFALIALATLWFGGTTDGALLGIRTAILILALMQIPFILREPGYFALLTGGIRPALAAFAFLLVAAVYQSFWPGASVERFATRENSIQLLFYFLFFMACRRVFVNRSVVRYFFALTGIFTFSLALLGMIQKLSGTTKVYWVFETGVSAFFGPFLYENNFGAFIVLAFPMLLAAAFQRAARPIRDWQAEEHRKPLILLASLANSGAIFFIFIAILTLAAAFYSESRSTAILLTLASLALLIGLGATYGKKRFVLSALIGAIALSAAVYFLEGGKFLENYKADPLKDSVSLRLGHYQDGLAAAFDKPLIGHGLGTYYIMSPYFITPHPALLDNEEAAYVHANNEYIELMSDAGIAGMAACAGALAAILCRGLRTRVNTRSNFTKMIKWQALFALSLFFISIGVDSHLRTPAIALLFIVQLALLARHLGTNHIDGNASEPEERASGTHVSARIAATAAIIAATAVLFPYSLNHYRALQLVDSDDTRLVKKGVLLERQNPVVHEKAADAFNRIADQADSSAEKMQFLLKSRESVENAAELSPAYTHYWHTLAEFEFYLGDKEKSISYLEKAVERSPANRLYGLKLLSMYLIRHEEIYSPSKKKEYWKKAGKLYWRLMSMKNSPEERLFQKWMLKYDPAQIKRLSKSL